MANHSKSAKRRLAKAIQQGSLETLVQAYAIEKERADEAMFRLCIYIYEQIETRDEIAAAIRQVRGCSHDESHRIATRLHRMAHDKDAMDDLINGTQPIAYRATMRKAVL